MRTLMVLSIVALSFLPACDQPGPNSGPDTASDEFVGPDAPPADLEGADPPDLAPSNPVKGDLYQIAFGMKGWAHVSGITCVSNLDCTFLSGAVLTFDYGGCTFSGRVGIPPQCGCNGDTQAERNDSTEDGCWCWQRVDNVFPPTGDGCGTSSLPQTPPPL